MENEFYRLMEKEELCNFNPDHKTKGKFEIREIIRISM